MAFSRRYGKLSATSGQFELGAGTLFCYTIYVMVLLTIGTLEKEGANSPQSHNTYSVVRSVPPFLRLRLLSVFAMEKVGIVVFLFFVNRPCLAPTSE